MKRIIAWIYIVEKHEVKHCIELKSDDKIISIRKMVELMYFVNT